MKKEKFKFFSALLAFALTFPLHFLYDKFPCFLTSIIAPVNESIWEHMKLLFGSIIISGIIQKIILIIKKKRQENICISNFIGAILSIPIFLIIYLPIYYIFGHNFIVTVIIMFFTILVAEYISYMIMNKKELKLENLTIIFVIIVYIVFGLLTYKPLNGDIFRDPIDNYYGIKK